MGWLELPDLNAGSHQDALTRIALAGLAFVLLEVALTSLLRGPITRMFEGNEQLKQNPKGVQVLTTTSITKVVGSIHNTIQLPLALLVLLDPAMQADPIHSTSQRSALMVLISAGYFVYDVCQVVARYEAEGPQYLVHAICCLSVFLYPVFSHTLQFYGAAFLMWELSTPFVHMRWLLYKMGHTKSRLYIVNGIAMVVVFFACRCAFGSYMSYHFWQHTQAELDHPGPGSMPAPVIWVYRVCNILLNMLNAFWFHKMSSRAFMLLAFGKAEKRTTHASGKDE